MTAGVTVGSRWSDNYDPRFPRIVEIVKLHPNGRVRIRTLRTGRETDTDASRFGKVGRTGFTLMPVPSHDPFERCPICNRKNPCGGHRP